jgi:predicted nucleic acid-binding protein
MADLLVLDTAVLIDYQRRSEPARAFVLPLIARNVAAVHPAAAAEMIDGALHRRDLEDTLKLLASLRRLVVKPGDFDRCLSLQTELRLSHGVTWPDCLIAATCIRLDVPLVTLNDRHFKPIRELSVIRPY